jgi:outer membrane immunogenic protein
MAAWKRSYLGRLAKIEVFPQHSLAKSHAQVTLYFLMLRLHDRTQSINFLGDEGSGMRRFAIVAAGLFSIVRFICPVSAADLPVKARSTAAAPAQFSWTGCFAGVHAGADVSYDKILSSGDFSSAGFIGGGQLGCDYQFASVWVVGVEGRAAWSNLMSNTAGSVTFPATGIGRGFLPAITVPTQFALSNDFLASATARVGHSFADRWLIFVRGGAAWTREKADHAFTVPAGAIGRFRPAGGLAVDAGGTMTKTGWTAGTGVEWAFAPHWSASLEYNYYDFGDDAFTLVDNVNSVSVSGSLKDRIHTGTVGLNYHF